MKIRAVINGYESYYFISHFWKHVLETIANTGIAQNCLSIFGV